MTPNIIKSEISHIPSLKKVIDSVALFPSEYLDEMMNDFFTNKGSSDDWLTMLLNDTPVAIAYFAPERLTDGTFNLYLIAIQKELQRSGLGTKLLYHIENYLRASGARILIVETSGLKEFANTRKFYEKCNYFKVATIRDFYKEGEDKIIFWKKLG